MVPPSIRRDIQAIGIAPLALVIALSLLDLTGLVVKNSVSPLGLLTAGFFAAIYALLVSSTTQRRVILYEDGIEVSGWFSARKLKRSEILGRRMSPPSPWGSNYIIIPTDTAARVLRLPLHLHVDADFFSWMKNIPVIRNEGQRTSFR
jgi:hypothetical protein